MRKINLQCPMVITALTECKWYLTEIELQQIAQERKSLITEAAGKATFSSLWTLRARRAAGGSFGSKVDHEFVSSIHQRLIGRRHNWSQRDPRDGSKRNARASRDTSNSSFSAVKKQFWITEALTAHVGQEIVTINTFQISWIYSVLYNYCTY